MVVANKIHAFIDRFFIYKYAHALYFIIYYTQLSGNVVVLHLLQTKPNAIRKKNFKKFLSPKFIT